MKIKSKNELFKDVEIEKPPKASFIYDLNGEPIYTCPHCKATATPEECDVIGAEPDCLFCPNCQGEFEINV